MAKRDLAGHVINSIAAYLSTTGGFIATFITLMVGVAIGAALHFDDAFMFTFNIVLSVAAIVISGIILVSGARSEAALHVKLDRSWTAATSNWCCGRVTMPTCWRH